MLEQVSKNGQGWQQGSKNQTWEGQGQRDAILYSPSQAWSSDTNQLRLETVILLMQVRVDPLRLNLRQGDKFPLILRRPLAAEIPVRCSRNWASNSTTAQSHENLVRFGLLVPPLNLWAVFYNKFISLALWREADFDMPSLLLYQGLCAKIGLGVMYDNRLHCQRRTSGKQRKEKGMTRHIHGLCTSSYAMPPLPWFTFLHLHFLWNQSIYIFKAEYAYICNN